MAKQDKEQINEVEAMVRKGETIMWRGRPDARGYMLSMLYNPYAFLSIFWILNIAAFMILVEIMEKKSFYQDTLYVGVVLIFMLPVFVYLAYVFLRFCAYSLMEYIITDKAIYLLDGFIQYVPVRKPFADPYKMELRRSGLSKKLGLGDIVFTDVIPGSEKKYSLCALEDYEAVYSLVMELQKKHDGSQIEPREGVEDFGLQVRFYDEEE